VRSRLATRTTAAGPAGRIRVRVLIERVRIKLVRVSEAVTSALVCTAGTVMTAAGCDVDNIPQVS
jgi:hypothetical protein